jgi:hypothetical protein
VFRTGELGIWPWDFQTENDEQGVEEVGLLKGHGDMKVQTNVWSQDVTEKSKNVLEKQG